MNDRYSPYVVARFWSKVAVRSKFYGGSCWLWQGAKTTRGGYGQFTATAGETAVRAHRVAWELFNGPIPDGLFACHACDTPACCNPDHLFLGTHADNMADMTTKGRKNSKSGRKRASKLTWEQVNEIRASFEGPTALGEKYGVTPMAIGDIKAHRTWREQ